MTTTTDSYRVKPRKSRDGFNLEGERISHGSLWYRQISDAVSFAEWNSRVNGCRVEILDEHDKVVHTEEFLAGDFAY